MGRCGHCAHCGLVAARSMTPRLSPFPRGLLSRLSSRVWFTTQPLTEDEWNAALAWGWPGSDGSSSSLDDIMGVRIGKTTTDPKDRNLPACRHDFFYELGRRFKLGPSFRKEADLDYALCCVARVQAYLVGWRVQVGIWRAWFRYYGLRLFGWRAWR